MKTRKSNAIPAALLVCLAPAIASAALLQIDDSTETISSFLTGPVSPTPGFVAPGSIVTNTQEGIGIFGGTDAHFEYFDVNPFAPAISQTLNFSIRNFTTSEDTTAFPGDTLSITLTGHTPSGGGDGNMSVDIHFRSDSLDEINPPALFSPITIREDAAVAGFTQAVPGMSDWYSVRPAIVFNTGLQNLDVQFSSIPEPGTIALDLAVFGAWLAGRRRGAKQSA